LTRRFAFQLVRSGSAEWGQGGSLIPHVVPNGQERFGRPLGVPAARSRGRHQRSRQPVTLPGPGVSESGSLGGSDQVAVGGTGEWHSPWQVSLAISVRDTGRPHPKPGTRFSMAVRDRAARGGVVDRRVGARVRIVLLHDAGLTRAQHPMLGHRRVLFL
jgi:hypothetical protein